MFDFLIKDRIGNPAGLNFLNFDVERFDHKVPWGPNKALLTTKAKSFRDLEPLLQALFYEVLVYNEGRICWWGFVNKVIIRSGRLELSISLDEMANYIKIKYKRIGTDGNSEEVETSWVSNELSAIEYRPKERIIKTKNTLTDEAALLMAQNLLKQVAWPMPSASFSDSIHNDAIAEIECLGWAHILDWLHYSQAEGKVEIGAEDKVVAITLGQAAYSSRGIRFTDGPTDDIIEDATGGFWRFSAGQAINISGSSRPDNNGENVIVRADSHKLVVRYDLDNADETWPPPGRLITFSVGSTYSKIAQVIQVGTWNLNHLALYLKASGEPFDSLVVSICPDNGDLEHPAPTEPILTFVLDSWDYSTEFEWVSLPVGNAELEAGFYWIVVERLNEGDDFYSVGTEQGDEQGLLLWNGTEWKVDNGVMLIRMIGSRRVGDLIADVLYHASPTISDWNYRINANGAYSSLYQIDEQTTKAVIEEFLEIGDEGRLIATIDHEKQITIGTEPNDDGSIWLNDHSVMRYGQKIDDTMIRPGWVGIEGIAIGEYRFFVEEVEWSKSGIRLGARNVPSAWGIIAGRK